VRQISYTLLMNILHTIFMLRVFFSPVPECVVVHGGPWGDFCNILGAFWRLWSRKHRYLWSLLGSIQSDFGPEIIKIHKQITAKSIFFYKNMQKCNNDAPKVRHLGALV
jgi:hypothetical protein